MLPFHKGQRVASHRRILEQSGFTTLAEHMLRSHQEHATWILSARPRPSWPKG
ncbi:hypothetical protein DFAR_3990003 [Desulfarculales bacterium]